MKKSKVQKQYSVDEILDNLRADAGIATWRVGYIKSIINNKIIPEKIGSSYSGYAVAVANLSVEEALILYCTRSWDRHNDVFSLPSITEALPSEQDIYTRRIGNFKSSPPSDLDITVKKRYSEYFTAYNAALNSDIDGSLRVIRTEELAHRTLNSHTRQKLEASKPIMDATYNLLVSRAEQTIALVNKLDLLLNGSSNPYSERIKNSTRYCQEFWRLIPNLNIEEKIS